MEERSMKQQSCKECGSIFHTAMYHKPKKAIKRTGIKRGELIPFHIGENILIINSKPRKKSSPRKLAKDKAWNAFSLYIRTRDCLRFTGDPERGICVTCKTPKLRKELQAGHFVGGRGNAVLFREDLVYAQCSYCNQKPPMGLGGNYAAYALFMLDEGHSREEIEGFLNLRHATKVYKIHDFIEIEKDYTQKLLTLL